MKTLVGRDCYVVLLFQSKKQIRGMTLQQKRDMDGEEQWLGFLVVTASFCFVFQVGVIKALMLSTVTCERGKN